MDQQMITFYVGDVTDEVRIAAQAYDSTASLVTQQNCNTLAPGTYYISLGDFEDLQSFVNTLEQASTLIYVPVEYWSDTKDQFSYMQHWTEFYLMFFKDRKTVTMNSNSAVGKELDAWLSLADTRQTDNAQLWIAGCSVTHGVGVEADQRYGQLIADQLNMPVSFLTAAGSSIIWAADQITRSDIRSGDTVVWGITHAYRFPYYHTDTVKHITYRTYQADPKFDNIVALDQLSNKNIHYRAVTSIYQVVNFCQKLGVKLFLGGILVDSYFLPYITDLPNYTQMFGHHTGDHSHEFFDIGSDNSHPGPLTHQYYAKTFLDRIANA